MITYRLMLVDKVQYPGFHREPDPATITVGGEEELPRIMAEYENYKDKAPKVWVEFSDDVLRLTGIRAKNCLGVPYSGY